MTEKHALFKDIEGLAAFSSSLNKAFNGVYESKIIGFTLGEKFEKDSNISFSAILAVTVIKDMSDVGELLDPVKHFIKSRLTNFRKMHQRKYKEEFISDISGIGLSQNPLTTNEQIYSLYFKVTNVKPLYTVKSLTEDVPNNYAVTDFTRIMQDLYSKAAINSFTQLIFNK